MCSAEDTRRITRACDLWFAKTLVWMIDRILRVQPQAIQPLWTIKMEEKVFKMGRGRQDWMPPFTSLFGDPPAYCHYAAWLAVGPPTVQLIAPWRTMNVEIVHAHWTNHGLIWVICSALDSRGSRTYPRWGSSVPAITRRKVLEKKKKKPPWRSRI